MNKAYVIVVIAIAVALAAGKSLQDYEPGELTMKEYKELCMLEIQEEAAKAPMWLAL